LKKKNPTRPTPTWGKKQDEEDNYIGGASLWRGGGIVSPPEKKEKGDYPDEGGDEIHLGYQHQK